MKIRDIEHNGQQLRQLLGPKDEIYSQIVLDGTPAKDGYWPWLIRLANLERSRRQKIALVGVAGGAAAQVARQLLPWVTINGCEPNREIVEIYRQHFAQYAPLDRLDCCQGQMFLAKPERYDLIVLDAFVQDINLNGMLTEAARTRLLPDGRIVMNCHNGRTPAGWWTSICGKQNGRWPGNLLALYPNPML